MFTSDKDLRKPLKRPQRPSSSSQRSSAKQNPRQVGGAAKSSAFQNDSDYVSKNPSDGSKGGGDDTIEWVKKERLEREEQREWKRKVVIIQAWYRGRKQTKKWTADQRQEFDDKMKDLEKVSIILKKTHDKVLVPPLSVSVLLLRQLLCGRFDTIDHVRLFRYCRSVLNTSLADLDKDKNIIVFLTMSDISLLSDKSDKSDCSYHKVAIPLLLHKLVRCVFTVIGKHNTGSLKSHVRGVSDISIEGVTREQRNDVLLQSLSMLLGLDTPFKIRLPDLLRTGFTLSRRFLLKDYSSEKSIKLTHRAENFGCSIFEYVGRSLYNLILSRGHMDISTTNDVNWTSKCRVTNFFSPAVLADDLVSMCLNLIHSLHDNEEHALECNDWVQQFSKYFLAVPLGTCLLSTKTLDRLSAPSMLSRLLKIFLVSSGNIVHDIDAIFPPSPHSVFTAGHWAFGNIASLFPFLPLTVALPSSVGLDNLEKTKHDLISDSLLEIYINILSDAVVKHRVPGVLEGKSGVVWQRTGAVLNASGVPLGLQVQVSGMFDRETCHSLYSRVFRPLPLPKNVSTSSNASDGNKKSMKSGCEKYHCVPPPRKEDIKDITAALASSGVKLAQKDMKERQAESTTSNSYMGLGVTSVWAKKISKSLGGMLFGTSDKSAEDLEAKMIQQINTNNSRLSSTTGNESKAILDNEPPSLFPLNVLTVQSLCGLWSLLLSSASAGSSHDSAPWQTLSSICFSTRIVGRLWGYALNASLIAGSSFASAGTSCSDFQLSRDLWPVALSSPSTSTTKSPPVSLAVNAVSVIVSVLKIQLIALDDDELYEKEQPIPMPYVITLVRCLNHMVFNSIQADPRLMLEVSLPYTTDGGNGSRKNKDDEIHGVGRSYQMDTLRCAVAVLADLHTRWARRPFASASLWEISEASNLHEDFKHVLILSCGGNSMSDISQKLQVAKAVMRLMPWVFPFYDRVKLFRDVIATERLSIQGNDDINSGNRSRGTVVRVRRQRLLADGIAALERVGNAIKDRIVVRYVNDFGEDESGIDVGGLFKDFLTDLSDRVFNPSFGLFCLTAQQQLYPHPNAAALLGDDVSNPNEMENSFFFIGRVLGKALYEDITIQPQFTHFFLAFMMGKYNFTGLVNDLSSLDPELYRNLSFLKTYDGDISDLCLTFSASDELQGKEIDFFPGGGDFNVTNDNRHRYIQLAAKYYLHDRLVAQARAFFRGLYQVISPELLGIFCAPELQVLISGADLDIDLDDLRANTIYRGGYHSHHPMVSQFWKMLQSFEEADRALLVKFVTSCQRPPSLGFGALNPPFCIQFVESDNNTRLPTASTCFNVLKLPFYSNKQILSTKMLAAIRSNTGFELS